jgi:hypothetical protein
VKLVDTPASGVGGASRGGSSPLLGTIKQKKPHLCGFFYARKYSIHQRQAALANNADSNTALFAFNTIIAKAAIAHHKNSLFLQHKKHITPRCMPWVICVDRKLNCAEMAY